MILTPPHRHQIYKVENGSQIRERGKVRLSNIELLRIIAMVLVMVVHSDFFSLGVPTGNDLQNHTIPTVIRILIQSFSICCVNVFVLISGYFGIRQKRENLVSFIYQILFFFTLIYVVCIVIGASGFSLIGILQCFCLTPSNWFIKAYLLLFIISPVLNAFVDLSNRKLHRNILIGFFLMQSIYGFLHAANFFENGYGTLSFIGLYLLGRYIYIYHPKFSTYNPLYDLTIYLVCALILTILSIVLINFHKNCDTLLFTYINPLVVIESLALVLFFSKLKFQSKKINWVAASAFSVYLFHANPNILNGYYKRTIIQIYSQTSGITTILVIALFIAVIFTISVLVDQIRKYSYEFVVKEIHNRRVESRHL